MLYYLLDKVYVHLNDVLYYIDLHLYPRVTAIRFHLLRYTIAHRTRSLCVFVFGIDFLFPNQINSYRSSFEVAIYQKDIYIYRAFKLTRLDIYQSEKCLNSNLRKVQSFINKLM